MEDALSNDQRKRIKADEFIKIASKQSRIDNLIVTESVNLKFIGITKKLLIINNCYFADEVILDSGKQLDVCQFSNCVFKKRFLIRNSKLESLKIAKCHICQYIDTKNLSSDRFEFESCIINNKSELQLKQFEALEFLFTKNQADSDVYLKPRFCKKVVIEGCEKNYLLTFSNLTNKSVVEEILLITYTNYRTDYLLRNVKVMTFKLFGELNTSRLAMNNLAIGTGVLDYFSNDGIIKLSDLRPLHSNSVLVLKNSSLGKAEISNSDFSKFKKVLLSRSSIIDIIPVNIEWCNKRNMESKEYSSVKENYRQLKVIAGKNDDTPTKLFFEKLEMNAYRKQLKFSRGSFVDRFILFTNRISNDFGLNWFSAFCWLLLTTIIWYTSIKYCLGYVYFHSSLIVNEIGKFLLFVNPIHQFEKIFGVELSQVDTGSAIFFDGISRIIGAYLIYQFVSAFRKYSKK